MLDARKVHYKDLKKIAEEVAENCGAESPEYKEALREYERAKMQYVRSKGKPAA
jgi:hypothetical protein